MRLLRELAVAVAIAVWACACHAAGPAVFDFEDGTLQGWKVISGEAGELPTGPQTARSGFDFNQQGRYFIGLYESPLGDTAQIVLESPTFTVNSNVISLLVGGGSHRELCYIALIDAVDSSEIYRETGRNSETMRRRFWDVSRLRGRSVRLRIVDAFTGGWGHLNVDDIRELSPVEEQAYRELLAQKERRYEDWLATVNKPAEPIVYKGPALSDVAFPLGGIGSGHVSLCGDGAVRQWQIFNRVNDACVVPGSFFALWAKKANSQPTVRLLQQTPVDGLPAVERAEFVGEYPVARVRYLDPKLPVQVSLRAFSPHIPMNAKDSATPAVIFEFTLRNPGPDPVEVSLLATLQNAAGYDGVSGISGVWNPAYGGNVNVPLSTDGYTGLLMSNPTLPADARQFGTMSLGVLRSKARVVPQWSDTAALWRDFSDDGSIAHGPAEPSARGRTWNGAVTVPLTLRPYGKMTVPIAWTWHFPNHYVWWDGREGRPRIGRMYNNWYEDAGAVAKHISANYTRLAADTERFRRTFYETTLPYWMLDRISAQNSTLVSQVAMWLEDGVFAGFEGSGCCPMNCAHVWNYEQQMAYLFPSLDRNMRHTDFFIQQAEDGAIRHRTRLPVTLPRETGPFVDGHLGCILKAYREHRNSVSGDWLHGIWPKVKLAMQFVLEKWDPNSDGVMVGEQWNTYDAAMYGPNTFIGTLYLAALRATEEMAALEGDDEFAQRLHTVFETGRIRLDEACWNGEYYRQIETKPAPEQALGREWLLEDWPVESSDAGVNRPYGSGCHADQLLGQWWAYILDLGYLLPRDRVVSCLDAMMKHNWVEDFGEAGQGPREFAGVGDPGLYTCTWPNGGKPANETLYSFEVWTGLEYEAAGLMLREQRPEFAGRLVKAVSDRYNGAARPPIFRNPWAEIECGNHYARAMSSWGILLAAQGFNYDGPAGAMEFDPVIAPDNHASFFTGAESWGLFTQRRAARSQSNALRVDYGRLRLTTLTLHLPESAQGGNVRSRVTWDSGVDRDVTLRVDGRELIVEFCDDCIIAGDTLKVSASW